MTAGRDGLGRGGTVSVRDGILLTLPPEWDATSMDRLREARDAAVAQPGLHGNPTILILDRMLQDDTAGAGDLFAWLMLPLRDESDAVVGLIFATAAMSMIEDPFSAPLAGEPIELPIGAAVRNVDERAIGLESDPVAELAVQFVVEIGAGRRLVAQFMTPNTGLRNEMVEHFTAIMATVRFDPK